MIKIFSKSYSVLLRVQPKCECSLTTSTLLSHHQSRMTTEITARSSKPPSAPVGGESFSKFFLEIFSIRVLIFSDRKVMQITLANPFLFDVLKKFFLLPFLHFDKFSSETNSTSPIDFVLGGEECDIFGIWMGFSTRFHLFDVKCRQLVVRVEKVNSSFVESRGKLSGKIVHFSEQPSGKRFISPLSRVENISRNRKFSFSVLSHV